VLKLDPKKGIINYAVQTDHTADQTADRSAYPLGTTYGNRPATAIVAVTLVGITLGLSIPLVAFLMDQQGASNFLVGLNAAMPSLAILCVTPWLPRLVARFRPLPLMRCCVGVSILCLLGLKAIPSMPVWFALRFVDGLAIAVLLTLTEVWINAVARDASRGRVVGLYTAMLSMGFALGPALLCVTGVDGWEPFIVGALLLGLGALPLWFADATIVPNAADSEAAPSDSTGPSLWWCVKKAPLAAAAALVYGAVDSGVFDLLPLHGLHHGLAAERAALMLTAAGAGTVLFQIPLGWAADHMDRRLLLLLCATGGLAGAISLPWCTGHPVLLWVSLFLWGGIVVGMYTVGLTWMGQRFRGTSLVAANAAFVLMFGLGSLAGPPAVGLAMDLWPSQGLALMLGCFCMAFVLYGGYRLIRFRQ
jgi:MFS family permease